MEDNRLSLEALALETMELSYRLKESGEQCEFSFEDSQEFDKEFSQEFNNEFDKKFNKEDPQVLNNPDHRPLTEDQDIPESLSHEPGLVYFIESGVSTFCLRVLATPNIAETFEDEGEGLVEKLNIKHAVVLDDLLFFETETFELAQVISDELGNRRFPIQEDVLCNLSDPGFSWWMDVGEDHFQIFYKSHGLYRSENYIRLGPLGDHAIASGRFSQAETLFRRSFPVGDFAISDKGFSITTTSPEHSAFKILRNIFLNGENDTDLKDFDLSEDARVLYLYFKERAALRSFWILVMDSIS